MREAIEATMRRPSPADLREAAYLPENQASAACSKRRAEAEGVAERQIGGRWRTHVLYASLRKDQRGLRT